MKKTSQCPKCGSKEIITKAKILDRTQYGYVQLTVMTEENPDALIFRGEKTSPVSPWICKSCGYTELYADHPDSL